MIQKTDRKAKKKILSIVCISLLSAVSITACSGRADKSSNIVFNKTKTQGIVSGVSDGKLTITVSEEDENFKEGDHVVVTYQDTYLDKADSDSDVLEKIDGIAEDDHVYVLYGEEECKDNVINVEYVVKAD